MLLWDQNITKLIFYCIFSLSKGVTSKLEAVSNPEKILDSILKSSLIVVCPWGEDGAAARDEDGTVLVSLSKARTFGTRYV